MARKKKPKVPKRRKRPTGHGSSGVGANDLPPILSPDQLLERGCPPHLIDEIMAAQLEAHAGNMKPMETAFRKLQNAVAAQQGASEYTPESAEDCYPLSNSKAARILYDFTSDDGMDPGYELAARQALAADSTSVEALSTIGDFASSGTEKLHWYRLACEAAQNKPRDRLAAEMPRTRLHMGSKLILASKLVDAVEIMQPALQESPEDEVGIRFALADLLLRLQWHNELLELVSIYDDPPSGILAFAGLIASFQRDGTSPELENRLRESHQECPQAARYLSGVDEMPQVGDQLTIDKQHAAMVAEYLLPGVRSKAGTARWIRDTLQLSRSVESVELDERQSLQDDEASNNGLKEFVPKYGSLDVALDLPDGKGTWRYFFEKIRSDFYVAGLVDDDGIVSLNRFSSPPGTQTLRAFLLESVCDPHMGPPRKPALLTVPTKANVKALEKAVGTYGVSCQQEKLSAEERKLIRSSLSDIASQLSASATSFEPERSPHDDDSREADFTVADSNWNALPKSSESWAIGLFQPPIWVNEGPTPFRPFLLLVVELTNGMIVGTKSWSSKPTPDSARSGVAEICHNPASGDARLPKEVLIDPQSADLLDCRDLNGIPVVKGDEAIAKAFEEIVRDLLRSTTPFPDALEEQEGVSIEFLAGLFNHLAGFYTAAPWRMTPTDHLIELRDLKSGQTWGVTVIGQLGQTIGVSLVNDIQVAKQFIENHEGQPIPSVITIQFVEEFEMSPLDHWSMERQGWKIGDEEAYPLIAKMNSEATEPECPNRMELERIDALLPALVHFVEQPRDTTHQFTDAGGNRYRLAWVFG